MKQILVLLSLTLLFACSKPASEALFHTSDTAVQSRAGVTVQIQDVNIVTGQQVEARFSVTGFTEITAFQYAMLFDTSALEYASATFTDTLPGYSMDGNFGMFWMGYNVEPGEIRTAWWSPSGYGVTVSPNAVTHSLFFTAKKSGTLSQYFAAWPDNPILGAVAYEFPTNPIALTVSYIPIAPPINPPGGNNGNPKKKKKRQ